jgi:calmodulin/calcium-binding protein CML/plastin-2
MAEQPSQDKLDEIRKNFDYFDRDGNGHIDVSEFTKLLKVIEPSSTKAQAEKGFDIIDSDDNGHIDLDEFIAWWQSHWWQY